MTSNDDQALLISPRQWLDCHAGGDVDDDDDDDDGVDDDDYDEDDESNSHRFI